MPSLVPRLPLFRLPYQPLLRLRVLRRVGWLAPALLLPLAPWWSPPAASQTTDRLWFVTNRAAEPDGWTANRGGLSFGARRVAVTAAEGDVTVTGEERLDAQAFVEAVREGAAPSAPVLVYVHGYAVSMDEGTAELAEMRARGGHAGPAVLFSWPASRLGMTWPTWRQPLTAAYWRDSSMAAASAGDLAATLRTLVTALGPGRVVLVAHSMGGQLVAAALADSALRATLAVAPLRAAVFVLPDVDAVTFRAQVVPAAAAVASRTVLYGARDDRMLWLSSVLRGGRPRAGRLDGAAPWPAGLEVVDMTDGAAEPGAMGSLLDTRHAIRREGTALRDLFGVVLAGAPPACRAALGLAAPEGGAWVALGQDEGRLEAVPPPDARPAGCLTP